MKFRFLFSFVALIMVTSSTSCDEDGNFDIDCAVDVAVTLLDAPARAAAGGVTSVICVISDAANQALSCGKDGPETVRVTCAYSPTFSDKFSDYEVYDDDYVPDGRSLENGDIRDEMPMALNQGPGFYAMRVEVIKQDDTNANNDARAVVIEAD